MKNVDSFVYGVVFGILFVTMLMGWFPEKTECEVKIGYGNGNRTHVIYGVRI